MKYFINAMPVELKFTSNSQTKTFQPGEIIEINDGEYNLMSERYNKTGVIEFTKNENLDKLIEKGLNSWMKYIKEDIIDYMGKLNERLKQMKLDEKDYTDEQKEILEIRNKVLEGQKEGKKGLDLIEYITGKKVIMDKSLRRDFNVIEGILGQAKKREEKIETEQSKKKVKVEV